MPKVMKAIIAAKGGNEILNSECDSESTLNNGDFLSISNHLDYEYFDQKYTTQKALFLKGKKLKIVRNGP